MARGPCGNDVSCFKCWRRRLDWQAVTEGYKNMRFCFFLWESSSCGVVYRKCSVASEILQNLQQRLSLKCLQYKFCSNDLNASLTSQANKPFWRRLEFCIGISFYWLLLPWSISSFCLPFFSIVSSVVGPKIRAEIARQLIWTTKH